MKWIITVLCLFFLLLLPAGCFSEEYNPTAEEFFRNTLNLAPLPPGISDFKKVSHDEFLIFDEGYFQYRATQDFIDALLRHGDFFMLDPGNEFMQRIGCDRLEFSPSASWARDLGGIRMAGKVCYSARYVPYGHIIIYDPKTQRVDHFYYSDRP